MLENSFEQKSQTKKNSMAIADTGEPRAKGDGVEGDNDRNKNNNKEKHKLTTRIDVGYVSR